MFKAYVSISSSDLNKPARKLFHEENQMRKASLTLDRSRWIISPTIVGAQQLLDYFCVFDLEYEIKFEKKSENLGKCMQLPFRSATR